MLRRRQGSGRWKNEPRRRSPAAGGVADNKNLATSFRGRARAAAMSSDPFHAASSFSAQPDMSTRKPEEPPLHRGTIRRDMIRQITVRHGTV